MSAPPPKKQLKIGVSPQLLTLIDRNAEALGLARSDYCRSLLIAGVSMVPWANPLAHHIGPILGTGPEDWPKSGESEPSGQLNLGQSVGPTVGPDMGVMGQALGPTARARAIRERERKKEDPPYSPPGPTERPTTPAAAEAQALTRELSELINGLAGTVLDPEDPTARATVSMRLGGAAVDGKAATADELREVCKGVAMSWEPHMITIRAICGPKYGEHRQRALAYLKNPIGRVGQSEGEKRAARHSRRRR